MADSAWLLLNTLEKGQGYIHPAAHAESDLAHIHAYEAGPGDPKYDLGVRTVLYHTNGSVDYVTETFDQVMVLIKAKAA